MTADHRNDKPKNGDAKTEKFVLNGGANNSNGINDSHVRKHSTATVPTHVAVPPDGGWGWVVVAASFCCNLVVDGIIYSFGMFLAEIAKTFGETKGRVSLVGSLLSGTYLIVGKFLHRASATSNVRIVRFKFTNIR